MKKKISKLLSLAVALVIIISFASTALAETADADTEETTISEVTAAQEEDTSETDTSETDSSETDTSDTQSGGFQGPGGSGGSSMGGGPGGSSSSSSDEYDTIYDDQTSIVVSVGEDENSRNVTWYFPSEEDGKLYIVKESALTDDGEMPSKATVYTVESEEANKTDYYYFQVTLDELEDGETYAYQLVNTYEDEDGETVSVESDIYTISISESDKSFTFAVAGDPQIGTGSTDTDTEGWGETLSVIESNSIFEDIDFLLSVGDQVDTASSESQYNGFLEHDELPNLTLATAIGNHDTASSSYSQHFNIVNVSTSLGVTEAGGDYYYVYEGVLFMILNSNNTSTSEHKEFMEEAIAATKDLDITWKVVSFHHSIYSVASHAEDSDILSRRETLVPVFAELDIDVVLMGHDHVYCRTYIMDEFEVSDDEDYEYDEDGVPVSVTNTDGILYVTFNSSSGSKYYSINGTDYEYAAVTNQEKTPNISLVTVTETSFTVTTYRTEDMSEVDTFTIYKDSEEEECEHVYDDGTVTTQATCTEEGVITYTCTICGETYTEAIAAAGHIYGSDYTFTWNSDYSGATAVFACTVCGETYEAAVSVTSDTDSNGNTVYTAIITGPDGEEYTETYTLSAEEETEGNSDEPETGDENNLFMWIYIACVAFMVCLALVIARKVKKEKTK